MMIIGFEEHYGLPSARQLQKRHCFDTGSIETMNAQATPDVRRVHLTARSEDSETLAKPLA
jgi:hypothetical protein